MEANPRHGLASHPRADDGAHAHVDAGPLQPLLDDPEVTEIMVNGPHEVFVERRGRKTLSDVSFASESALRLVVERLFAAHGKRIGTDMPYGDVCLADGTRVNAILAPIARFGIAVTLRKFSQKVRTLDDLIQIGTLSVPAAHLLVACIKGKVNILVSGGTSSGKTTLLQILSSEFDPAERVITIEDAAELRIGLPNVISLETRAPDDAGRGEVTLRHLIRNALRMAPDRLILGEVRGVEALDMVQAMATGHAGTLGVVHGSSPAEALMRLETMILMTGLPLPLSEVRRMMVSTIQLIVHLERSPAGRLVTAITELRGIHAGDGEFVTNDLFLRAPGGKTLDAVMQYYPHFYQRLKDGGLLTTEALQSAEDALLNAARNTPG